MSQADLLENDPVFQLKGSMLAVTVLELTHNDLPRLDRQLAEKVAQAPNFFHDTPLVLALDKLPASEGQLDLQGLLDACRRHGLRTLAIRANREEDIRLATMLDIPVLPPSAQSNHNSAKDTLTGAEPVRRPRSERLSEKLLEPAAEEPSVTSEATECRPTKVITTPVRGGAQIYAAGGDLIVLAPVSAGAELLADGNIHVYGPLRGRALAGVKGDQNARIFCQQLAAELLSIAGNYKIAEDLRRSPQWGQAVQVSLSGDVLNITRL